MTAFTPAFGRVPAPDPNDRKYPMRAMLSTSSTTPRTRYWAFFAQALNQGATSSCVGHAWTSMLLAAPTVHGPGSPVRANPSKYAIDLYEQAKTLDEWDGSNYDGTSVRAGAKALTAQGRLASYLWAWDAATVQQYVLQRGVVVVGTAWHNAMTYPDADGFLTVSGAVVGGHAYALIGYSEDREAFRVINSWGPFWGQNGRAWLRRADLAALLADGGEAVSGVEQKVPAMKAAA
jgi:hypothetical protein